MGGREDRAGRGMLDVIARTKILTGSPIERSYVHRRYAPRRARDAANVILSAVGHLARLRELLSLFLELLRPLASPA